MQPYFITKVLFTINLLFWWRDLIDEWQTHVFVLLRIAGLMRIYKANLSNFPSNIQQSHWSVYCHWSRSRIHLCDRLYFCFSSCFWLCVCVHSYSAIVLTHSEFLILTGVTVKLFLTDVLTYNRYCTIIIERLVM